VGCAVEPPLGRAVDEGLRQAEDERDGPGRGQHGVRLANRPAVGVQREANSLNDNFNKFVTIMAF
jgi:hypothetical protein